MGAVTELWFTSEPPDDTALPSWRRVTARGRQYGQDLASPQRTSTPSPSDAEIIAGIRAGESAVFDTLFRAEFFPLVKFTTVLLGSQTLAEEVTAEVFLRIWRSRDTWNPQGALRAYLFRAVKNEAANVRRGERRSTAFWTRLFGAAPNPSSTDGIPGMAQSPPNADAQLEHDEVLKALWRAIDTLPPQRRAVAYLRWREGMSYEEIAAITGQSAVAAKKQVNRVVDALRALLGGNIR